MPMAVWVIAVIVAGFGLMVSIELILIRLNIRPADPDLKSGGMRDVAERINRWSAGQRRDR